ncbi:MAG: hypothetical protein IJ641_01770 [Lachnospiraceae bacterium]|nr:hypothetical protein [Lachnospiraceae bacterium]
MVMKETLTRILSFIVIFIISASIFSATMSHGNTTTTAVMRDASLPVVSVMYNGSETNTMHGLVSEPDLKRYRADLSPLGEGRTLGIKVEPFKEKITGIAYEVRSSDGSRLIESAEVYDYSEQGNDIYTTVRLKDLISDKTEYSLCIVLTLEGGRKARYYTRVISDDSLHVTEMVTFVNEFSNITMDKEAAEAIAPYLESDSTGDNSTFAHVDIHSSFDQVTWGELQPQKNGETAVRVLDVAGDIGSFMITYRMICGIDNKDSDYDIREYYRLRYSDERMYLLDYERTMNEEFTGGKSSFANDKIILGIHERNVEMAENNAGNSIAFVSGGALFSYKAEDSHVARVFSFADEDHDDERTRYQGYDIKILSVDEGGNVRFLVYGYHNRGDHEGEICAVVYYYDSALNIVEEEISVPYSGSSEMLEANIRQLSYVDSTGNFYLYIDGSIYRINVAQKSVEIIASGVAFDETASSASGKIGAYIAGDEIGAGSSEDISSMADAITLIDMSDGRMTDVHSDPGCKIRLLGFIGEDMISGQLRIADKTITPLGMPFTPMSSIRITGGDGTIKKEYSEDGYYISDVKIEGSTIYIDRMIRSGDGSTYVAAEGNQIMSSSVESGTQNKIVVAATEQRETITEIQLINDIAVSRLQLLTPDFALFEGDRSVSATKASGTDDKGYLVYAKGGIEGASSDPGTALRTASDEAGIVLNMKNSYIWRKGSRDTKHTIAELSDLKGRGEHGALYDCMDAVLSYAGSGASSYEQMQNGETSEGVLEANIDGDALSLMGIGLSDVLYYVSKDCPVIGLTVDGPVLIVGYDMNNTIVYDPSLGITHHVGMNDSREMFEEAGNEYLTYINE